ncbi:hypothetical protein ACFLYS_01205 [Chloroflexota bacterium]
MDKVVGVRLPEDVVNWLEDTAKSCGITKSRLAHNIILSGYIAQQKMASRIKRDQSKPKATETKTDNGEVKKTDNEKSLKQIPRENEWPMEIVRLTSSKKKSRKKNKKKHRSRY